MKPYLEIMEHFGYRMQMKKLAEECFEFLEAVDNHEDMCMLKHNKGDGDTVLSRTFVVEEMADMLTLLTQFIARYNIRQDELDAFIDYKIERTLERIRTGYYEKKDKENS